METIFLMNEKAFLTSKENIEKPIEEQLFLYHTKNVSKFSLLKKVTTDTHVYWIESVHTPRFNKKLFYTNNASTGISLDKKTKVVKLWFGKRPHPMLIESFIAYHNAFTDDPLPWILTSYFTKSLAQDIAKNKVNNFDDLAVHLSKKSLMFKTIDAKDIKTLIYKLTYNNNNYISLGALSDLIKVSKNVDEAVDYLLSTSEDYKCYTLITKAMAVNELVDISSRNSVNTELVRINVLYNAAINKYNLPTDIPF
jgi:hypothetical protein